MAIICVCRHALGWDPALNVFTQQESLRQFYRLITPYTPEEGGHDRPAKIKAYGDVRQLQNILPNTEARRYLFDPERPFLDSLTVASREEMSKKWRNELTEATASLESIGALEVRNFSGDDMALLDRLIDAASQIREVYNAVNRNSQVAVQLG